MILVKMHFGEMTMGILAVVLIALGFGVVAFAKTLEGLLFKFLVLFVAGFLLTRGFACVQRTNIHYKLCRAIEILLALASLASFFWALLP